MKQKTIYTIEGVTIVSVSDATPQIDRLLTIIKQKLRYFIINILNLRVKVYYK